MRHLLPVIFLLLFVPTDFVSANKSTIQYPHEFSDSKWFYSGDSFACELKNYVSGLGNIVLTAGAGDVQKLDIVPDPFSDMDREVTVSLKSPPWGKNQDETIVARGSFYEGDSASINLNTLLLMKSFQQGSQLQIKILMDVVNDAIISVNSIDIQGVAEQFYRCMDGLLFLSFDQAEHNVFYYSTGHLLLSEEQRALLKHIADYVLADVSVKGINIDAHTDSYGDELQNRELSKKRAWHIVDSFKGMGVPEAKIKMRFHGERYPIADNGNQSGRNQNRRVEIWLKR